MLGAIKPFSKKKLLTSDSRHHLSSSDGFFSIKPNKLQGDFHQADNERLDGKGSRESGFAENFGLKLQAR